MSSLNGKGRTVQLADGPFTIHYTGDRLMELEKRCDSYAALFQMALGKVATGASLMLWAAGGGDTPEAAGARLPMGSVSQVRDALLDELVIALGAGASSEVVADAEANGVDPTTPAVPSPGANSTDTRG